MRLQALEATEHTIHRNILHSLNKTKLNDFKKGDRVILSNPELNLSSGLKHQSRDPFCPLNVIGVIIGALPGGMFKVQMEDGDEIAVRSVFAGQMALFSEQTQSSSDGEDDTSGEQLNVKQIQDSVSAFAFAVRKEIYKKKLKLPSGISNESVGAQFDMLYDCLDCGVLATLFALVGDEASSTAHHEQFTAILTTLQNAGFRYFLYGTISWEHHRKLNLGPRIDDFLLSVSSEEGHDCIKCLSGSGDCQHACCQNLALKFVVKCGLVDVSDDGTLRLERNSLSDKPNAADSEPPNKKKKRNKKTCKCSDSCAKNPGKCGFHRNCCIRLERKCMVASHKSIPNSKTDAGKSKSHPISVDGHDCAESDPLFNFTASLDDVWQKNVPDGVIVAEQHGCSVTSRDLYTLKPKEWVNNVIIDYIGKDLMAECGDVFIAETLFMECIREEKYNQYLPVDFNVKKDNYNKFIFPVHTLSRDHWWCVIVDISKKQYMELDSLNVMRRDDLLHRKLCNWFLRIVGLDISNFKLLTVEDRKKLPTQEYNRTECGVFLLSFTMAVSLDNAFNFKLNDMCKVRRHLADMILMGGRRSMTPQLDNVNVFNEGELVLHPHPLLPTS